MGADPNEVNVKRVYWCLGSGMMLLGAWFFASPILREGTPAPVRGKEDKPGASASSIAAKTEMGEIGRAPIRPKSSKQEVHAVYAGVAPQAGISEGETREDAAIEEQVTLLRKPVIDAIRLLDVTKADKYERMREALRHSGDSVETWTHQAPDVFAAWDNLLQGKGHAEVDQRSVRCYLAGCEVQVYFETEAHYESTAQTFRSLSEKGAAHGGRVQTPPKQLEDGRWVAAWMMLRPDVAIE